MHSGVFDTGAATGGRPRGRSLCLALTICLASVLRSQPFEVHVLQGKKRRQLWKPGGVQPLPDQALTVNGAISQEKEQHSYWPHILSPGAKQFQRADIAPPAADHAPLTPNS